MESHLLRASFRAKVYYWPVLLIRCAQVRSQKWSTMTWAAQMLALMIFPDNCGTIPVCADFSWSTDTAYPVLLSVYFFMDPDLFSFVLHCLLLAVTNMHDVQRGTSSFKSRNLDGRTPSFESLNMDLGWR